MTEAQKFQNVIPYIWLIKSLRVAPVQEEERDRLLLVEEKHEYVEKEYINSDHLGDEQPHQVILFRWDSVNWLFLYFSDKRPQLLNFKFHLLIVDYNENHDFL